MRIALIRPNIGRLEHSLFVDEARMEPLELAVLAGLTPEGHEQFLIDDRVEEINFDIPVDLAAVTVQTYTARRAYEICAEYRKRRVPVVIGGMHAGLAPSETARHADAIAYNLEVTTRNMNEFSQYDESFINSPPPFQQLPFPQRPTPSTSRPTK